VGWTHFQRDSAFATLWAGSTLPQYRGRGLYTMLTAARVKSALRRGRRWAVVMAGEMSRPIVAKHGFIQVGENTGYDRAASGTTDDH
jgi:predicted GNAT family acetyltransferase